MASIRYLLGPSALLLLSCSDRSLTEGLQEPFAVNGAQFVKGDLPGSPPLTLQQIEDGQKAKLPAPSAPGTSYLYFRQGLAGVDFLGSTTDDSLSLLVKLEDEGTGYWVLPAGVPETSRPDFLTYGFTADFHHSLAPGMHRMLVAAVDVDGKSGTQAATELCINSLVPDNGNACYPETQPPDLVVSLSWDAEVDLDLVVVTPTGKIVDSKNPTTAERGEDGSFNPDAPGVGNLDIDSNKDCVPDGRQRENLVFQTVPRDTTFQIYANLNRACGQSAVRYELSYHGRTSGEKKGTFSVETSQKAEGTLVAAQANGGAKLGTFITDLKIGN